ncbi:MAG: TA system VapC family ribonuclease toxin [Marmoricola sp.]
MIAVDTNILVYAHREDTPQHGAARDALRSLAETGRSWGVPWPCVHEFTAIVTHRRIFAPPSSIEDALQAISDLLELPGVTTLGEGPDHLQRLALLLRQSGVVGPKVHDARIVAICATHGVRELWTADRDFSYFRELATRNPLV